MLLLDEDEMNPGKGEGTIQGKGDVTVQGIEAGTGEVMSDERKSEAVGM